MTPGAFLRSWLARLTREPRRVDGPRFSSFQRTLAGVYIDPDRALQNPVVWACVRYLSQTVAVLPWHVKRALPKGGAELLPNHPVDWVLAEEPNPETDSFAFRETMMKWALLWGNGYAEIERDNAGRVLALWLLHPRRVTLKRDDAGMLLYEVANDSGPPTVLAPMDVFHVRGMGDGPVGLSVIEHAAQSIGWAQATELFGAAFFGEGMNPAGVVEGAAGLKTDGLARLKKEFEKLYKGVRRSNRTAFLDAGMTWKKISATPDESQFVETMQHQVPVICRWFGVPPHKVAHLLHATFCLPADAKVFTVEGPKRIADVAAGELVWSRADRGEWICSRVQRSAPTGIDRILRLRTTNRTLRLNARHRVLARRAHEVPLQAGQVGGRNVDGKKVRLEWRTEFVAAGELRAGDTVVTLERLPDLGGREAPNGRKLTPGFMAFCGLLLGDGNVFAGSVSIARAAAAAYMDRYRQVMTGEFTAAANRGGFRAAVGARRPVLLCEGERQTRFASIAAAQELASLGFSGTARTKRVPGWVFALAEDLRLAFLAGFLDADGSVDKKGRMAFHSVSPRLLDDVRHLCIGLGIPVTNARNAKVRTILPNGESFEGEINAFTCSDPGTNRRVPTATPVYRERMEAGRPFGRKDRAYPRFGGDGFDEPGCGLSRIVEIVEERAEAVYDLTVAGTHNFVADGVVVHNSNIEHQSIEVVVDSIVPWVTRFEREANRKLFGRNRRGLFTKMNVSGLLRGDYKTRAEGNQVYRNAGVLSVNEIREFEGLNPVGPEGDVRVMQGQYVPLERLLERPPAHVSPPPGGTP